MGRYVVRRLLQFIPTLFGALFLVHYLVVLGIQINGNPLAALFGERTPPPAVLEAVTRQFKLDDPCLTQTANPCVQMFFTRLVDMFQLELGMNFSQRPVTDILATAIPITARLTLIAILVQIVIGLTAGILAGLRAGGFVDYLVKITTVLIISIPVFVSVAIVQAVIAVNMTVFGREQGLPVWLRQIFSITYVSDAPWLSLFLPGFALGLLGLAVTARLTRTSLVENLRSDYVRTAVAKGLRRRRVVGVHTLRNSLLPVVTELGYSVGGLMGGAVVTETIFAVPGVGFQIIRAVQLNEGTVLVSLVTFLVLVYLVANLLVDLLYAVLDPRIRYD